MPAAKGAKLSASLILRRSVAWWMLFSFPADCICPTLGRGRLVKVAKVKLSIPLREPPRDNGDRLDIAEGARAGFSKFPPRLVHGCPIPLFGGATTSLDLFNRVCA